MLSRAMAGRTSDSLAVDPGRTRFVLVEPQSGGNVGSVARVLKNLGFERLVLVQPACDPRGREARMMAVDALDLLERAEIHADLDGALDGARTVVATSRRTGKHRRPHYRLDRIAPRLARLARAGELALLFGREDHGLTDRHLDRSTHLVHLLAGESYPSFNVAQAVAIVAYELRRAEAGPPAEPLAPPAAHAEREALYAHLEEALTTIGVLHRDSRVPIMRRLRRLLGRADPTTPEVKLLRGIAQQILWVAGRARVRSRESGA
jgi:TrmH family RNA methyltransferase